LFTKRNTRDGRLREKPSAGVGTCPWHVRGRAKRTSLQGFCHHCFLPGKQRGRFFLFTKRNTRDGRLREKPSAGVGTCLWHVRGRAKRTSLQGFCHHCFLPVRVASYKNCETLLQNKTNRPFCSLLFKNGTNVAGYLHFSTRRLYTNKTAPLLYKGPFKTKRTVPFVLP
jgi:hypothetical protein